MDCRDHKSILKNSTDDVGVCSGYNISAKRASFNDNGVLKRFLIDRINVNTLADESTNVTSLKDSTPVLEVLEENVISVPIEDVEEKTNDEEELERKRVFEEKRKCHERMNVKDLFQRTDSDVEEEPP